MSYLDSIHTNFDSPSRSPLWVARKHGVGKDAGSGVDSDLYPHLLSLACSLSPPALRGSILLPGVSIQRFHDSFSFAVGL
jgi:hypothetical protein